MDERYLSENIVIKDNFTYYKNKLVKRHNWHQIFSELGWEKLHRQWIKKLNKLYNPYPNNSLFGCLECGDDGDCMFHCISQAINSYHDDYLDSQDVRNKVAESITQNQFNDIISCYRCMKDMDDFDESWDPYEVDTLTKFKEEICKSGHSYWGDHLLLQLVSDIFNINIFVITQNEILDIYDSYPTAFAYDKLKNSIILIHENNSHFKLLGHFNNTMITYFDDTNLPLEIKRLFNLQ